MDYKNLLIEEGKVTLVRINRPEKLNALNKDTLEELWSVLNYIKKNNDILALVITGMGEKAFAAGADIKELNACDTISGKDFSSFGQNVFNLIENLGKPVIAAVNGFALGGGCELALACHFRLASENAKFGQPEVNLGIIPGYGGTQRLTRLINSGRAAELILTGNMIDANEAFRIGLVNHVYKSEDLINEAIKTAEIITTKGQIAVRLALESINSSANLSKSEGLKIEANLFSICCGSNDFKEGTKAFLEKRKPEFKGK